MKSKLKPRELALICLPVVLLVGVGWWLNKGGSLSSLRGEPADLYTGQPRVENEPVKSAPLSSWDVAQGFVWAGTTTIWQKGVPPLSPTAQRAAREGGSVRAHLVYKQNGVWKKVSQNGHEAQVSEFATDKDDRWYGNFSAKRLVNFKVRLKDVPRDAEEVHLKGHFEYRNYYQGAACGTINSSPNWTIFVPGKICDYTASSKPFDLTLKAQGSSWPSPAISHSPNLQLVDAHWMYTPNVYSLALHVRDPNGILAANNQGDLALRNFSLQDEHGKEIPLYYYANLGGKSRQRFYPSSLGFIYRSSLNSDLPTNEYVADLAVTAEPLKGWNSVEGPLHLRAQISDWSSWPTSVDVKMNLEQGSFRDIEARKGTVR